MAAGAVAGQGALGQVGMGAAFGGTDAAMRMVLAYRQTEESSADQAAVTFLNATKQSGRGLIETMEFMNSKIFGIQGINPYLQSHPLPAQRIVQLRALVEQSPYFNNVDSPELQLRHDLVRPSSTASSTSRRPCSAAIRQPTTVCRPSMRGRSPPTGNPACRRRCRCSMR
jgi:predicted Zn-dependent protease